MLQRMTNPKTTQRFYLSHLSSVARSHGLSSWLCVPVIWIPPTRRSNYSFKHLSVICCLVIIMWQICFFVFFLIYSEVWECVLPLCPVCAGCPESVIGPWDWTHPAPGCPGCDVGGHDLKSCPLNFAVPPWPAAALPPVKKKVFWDGFYKCGFVFPKLRSGAWTPIAPRTPSQKSHKTLGMKKIIF